MSYLYYILPLLILWMSYLSVYVTKGFIPLIIRENQHLIALDGFRGILALSVFIHHASAWKYFIVMNQWMWPPLKFYVYIGSDAVAFFFMITGFLFVRKIINAKHSPISWKDLYLNRIRRIVPLYMLMFIFVLIIVGIKTGWVLQSSKHNLAESLLRWLGCGYLQYNSAAYINNFKETFHIVSGVVWTLTYEWLFYLALPLIDILINRRISVHNIIACVVASSLFLLRWNTKELFSGTVAYFATGAFVAFLFGNKYIVSLAQKKWTPFIIILSLIFAHQLHFLGYLLVTTIILTLIVNGCSCWGFLANTTIRRLGEISYSIYLLHGILLYVSFNILLPYSISLTLARNDLFYWLAILILTFILILFCQVTFKYVESKFMQRSKNKAS